MRSINDITDEKVRRLAETLKQSGLAASETEAIRMAMSMTNTTAKVNQVFDERKDRNIMGLSNLKKNQSLAQAVDEPARTEPARHQEHKHVPVREQEAVVIEQETDCACGGDCNCGPECGCSDYEDDQDNVIHQDLAGEPKHEAKPEPKKEPEQPPKTATPERAPPKRDISQMEESKVDLSKVFGFKK